MDLVVSGRNTKFKEAQDYSSVGVILQGGWQDWEVQSSHGRPEGAT